MNASEARTMANEYLVKKANQSILNTLYHKIESTAKKGHFSTTCIINNWEHSPKAIVQVLKNDGFSISFRKDIKFKQFEDDYNTYIIYDISWE